jgi:hypothetical protein
LIGVRSGGQGLGRFATVRFRLQIRDGSRSPVAEPAAIGPDRPTGHAVEGKRVRSDDLFVAFVVEQGAITG